MSESAAQDGASGKRATALSFPCIFPIKAMGPADGDLQRIVTEIVARHAPDLAEDAVRTRASRGGRWLSVTVRIEAKGQDQLDAIYRELTAHEMVVYVL